VTSPNDRLPQDPARIRRKRIEAGLSQPALAAKANVNKSTVYRAENGLCPAEAETLRRLAEALGCEIADLMPPEPAEARS
jgi:transcriptional regulator with XRE-family HTH domain